MESKIRTVLLVDDDPDRSNVLSRVVGTEYPVASCARGEDACRKARAIRPDAIVLDLAMPGSDDAIRIFVELKKNEESQNIPVIVLIEASHGMAGADVPGDMRSRLAGPPPVFFLDKTVSGERLLDEIRRSIGPGLRASPDLIEFPGRTKGDSAGRIARRTATGMLV